MKQKNDISRNKSSGTAYLLIGLGALLLLAPALGFSFFGTLWPLLVVLPGAGFLYAARNGGKNASGLAVPGAIVTGTGAILFYQNITGHWASWAYVWTLYPVFLGLALKYMGQRTDNRNEINIGRGFVRYGLMAFTIFALIFEVLIFNGGGVLPFLLIGVGLLMMLRGGTIGSQRRALGGSHRSTYHKRKTHKLKNGYHSAASQDLMEEIEAALAEDSNPEPVA